MDLDHQELTVKIFMVRVFMFISLTVHCWQSKFWWSIINTNSWQFTIDYQLLMDLDHQELTVQLFMVRMLMVHFCWSTLDSLLLPPIPKDQVLANLDCQLLMDLDQQELIVQILMAHN